VALLFHGVNRRRRGAGSGHPPAVLVSWSHGFSIERGGAEAPPHCAVWFVV
jgi:hypothetical protein